MWQHDELKQPHTELKQDPQTGEKPENRQHELAVVMTQVTPPLGRRPNVSKSQQLAAAVHPRRGPANPHPGPRTPSLRPSKPSLRPPHSRRGGRRVRFGVPPALEIQKTQIAMTTATARRQRRGSKPPQESKQELEASPAPCPRGRKLPRPAFKCRKRSQPPPPARRRQRPTISTLVGYPVRKCQGYRLLANKNENAVDLYPSPEGEEKSQMRFAVADVWEKGPKDVH
ncbi:hypothetical protein C0Q70_18574 [Pomacea canaliculata]|uniref:Uncharacterized protein n=1 Tax=Pomacea canaliculata TaxID=400727 RepID=A0A2T7NGW7_POMCA|nr:hypothetical protein C0Q70_18574 [Pomacea canaliculata]